MSVLVEHRLRAFETLAACAARFESRARISSDGVAEDQAELRELYRDLSTALAVARLHERGSGLDELAQHAEEVLWTRLRATSPAAEQVLTAARNFRTALLNTLQSLNTRINL